MANNGEPVETLQGTATYSTTWNSANYHVEEGDELTLKCHSYSSSYYCFLTNFAFEADCLHEDYTKGDYVSATCEEGAYWNCTCNAEDCKENFKLYDAYNTALGHEFSAFVKTVAPTCTEQGYDLYECVRYDNCGETEQKNVVAAKGHDFSKGDICSACSAPKTWDGSTKTEPSTDADGVYLINTGAELAWFADAVNTSTDKKGLNAKLVDNIDLGSYAWTPIGKSTTYYYSGTFDGNEHKITNLSVTGSSDQKITGLFGCVYGGTIKNLSIDGTVTGYTLSGGYSGGFVGQTYGVTMENCSNYATVSGYYSGGLVGTSSSTSGSFTRTVITITNCYNAGNISGNEAGGLFGEWLGGKAGDSINNGFTYGTISATSSYYGTVYGYAQTPNPLITNFYYLNTQTYASSYTKGTGKNATEFMNLASTLGDAFVNGETHPVLTWEAAPIHNHDYSVTCNGDGTHTLTCKDTSCGDTQENVKCDNTATTVCSVCGYTNAEGSKWNPIKISTAADMKALSEAVRGGDSKAGVYYELTTDLTLDGSFKPIGTFLWGEETEIEIGGTTIIDREKLENAFAGVFDGKGHTVTVNITDNTGSDARVGLFGSVVGGTVKNVIVTGSVQTAGGGNRVGGLVGYAQNATIENCGNAAAVVNADGTYAGGILGSSGGNVTITGCFNVGSVTAEMYAGGILGSISTDVTSGSTTTITDCYDMGSLTATDANGSVGGIVASPSVGHTITLTNCYAGGTYTATKAGAIIGSYSAAMTMSNIYYKADSWYGGNLTTAATPTKVDSFEGLAAKLGSSFTDGSSYPLLSWQSAATAPSEGVHSHDCESAVTAPTCTKGGYTTYTCACGYSYTGDETEALGHQAPADASGYTHDSVNHQHSYTCARSGCGETITADCTYGSGVVTTEPTKTEAGVMTYTCTVCKGTKTEPIAANDFAGEGTAEDPFQLYTADDLKLLSEKVAGGLSYAGKYFKLMNDVEIGEGWTAIGARSLTTDTPFSGHFNGDYHTVTITYSNAEHDFNGLFGAIYNATVEKVIVKGSITGGSFTAGVVGHASNSTIRYCGNEAAITGGNNHTFGQNQGPNDAYTGGVVAYAATNTRISACYNRGDVKNDGDTNTSTVGKSQYTGGIAGNLYGNCAVQYCYNTGAVTSTGSSYTYTGGIVGMSQTGSLMNSYSTGTINASGTYTGGILGSGNMYYQQEAYSYYLTGSASAGSGTGTDSASYITSASEADLKNAESAVRKALGENFVDTKDGGYPLLAWEIEPDAEVSYVNAISTASELREFANNIRAGYSYDGETVVLANDIDLEGYYDSTTYANLWTAVGDVHGTLFEGSFDGKGHTIKNMVILNNNSGSLGMFSVLPAGAEVKNLTVTGSIVSSSDGNYIGSIAGRNLGTIENCVSVVNIDVSNYEGVGGIAGDNAGTVRGCVNKGALEVSVGGRVGGVVGRMEPAYDADGYAVSVPVLENNGNTGNIDVYGSLYVGGVVGAVFNEDLTNVTALSIENCYNMGDIKDSSSEYVGGIVGQANLSELSIVNCYTGGEVSETNRLTVVGAVAGSSKASILNSYYLLGSMMPVGSGSGENYARPVSEAYLGTAAFAELLGGAFEAGNAYPTIKD